MEFLQRQFHNLAVFLTAGLFISLLTGPGIYLYAYGKGAKPASTNAPGESSCQGSKCHAQNPLNSGGGELNLHGVPTNVEPDTDYPITIMLQQEGQKRWGFQITALGADSLASGTFKLSDEDKTQLRDEEMPDGTRRLYVEHTLKGSHMGSKDGPVSWDMVWRSPTTVSGPTYFYVAANAANFNKKPWGDYIYTLIDTATIASS